MIFTNTLNSLLKLISLFFKHYQNSGLKIALIWAFSRGFTKLTGIPIVSQCKVTNQVYVGSQFSEKGLEKLNRIGITNILNLRKEFDDSVFDLSRNNYCYLPVIDDTAPTEAELEEGVEFIQNTIRNQGKVYVHCAAGVGRSVTIVAAWLIKENNLSVEESLNKIKINRPFILPVSEQLTLLRNWETKFKNYHE